MNNHLPSEEPSPRLVVLILYELTEAVHLLDTNPGVRWQAHVTGTAHESVLQTLHDMESIEMGVSVCVCK